MDERPFEFSAAQAAENNRQAYDEILAQAIELSHDNVSLIFEDRGGRATLVIQST